MKELIVYMDSSVTVDVNLPAEKIDLKKWLYEMTDSDYRSYSPAHLAMGISSLPDGRFICINVEKIGSNILLHHYIPEAPDKHRMRMVSGQSKAFSGSRVFIISVTWELTISSSSPSSSRLTNHVTVATDNKIVAWIGKRMGSKASHNHNLEESALFAGDIEKKFSLPS